MMVLFMLRPAAQRSPGDRRFEDPAAPSTRSCSPRSPAAGTTRTLADRDDVFSALLLAEDEDGERLSDREVRDELMTLLLAGHETTATGLAWTFDLLLHHPAVTSARSRATTPTSTRSSRSRCGCAR